MKNGIYSFKAPLFQLFTYDKSNPIYYLNYYMLFSVVKFSKHETYFCFQVDKKHKHATIVNMPVADTVYKVEDVKANRMVVAFILDGRHDFWVMDKYQFFGRDDRDEWGYLNDA